MTTRRTFLTRLAPAVAVGALVPVLVPIIGKGPPDVFWAPGQTPLVANTSPAEFYHPYGYVKGGDPICSHIRAITLDGEAIPTTEVMEADDRAGWMLIYKRVGSYLDDGRPAYGTVRRTGEVRFVWSEEALT